MRGQLQAGNVSAAHQLFACLVTTSVSAACCDVPFCRRVGTTSAKSQSETHREGPHEIWKGRTQSLILIKESGLGIIRLRSICCMLCCSVTLVMEALLRRLHAVQLCDACFGDSRQLSERMLSSFQVKAGC